VALNGNDRFPMASTFKVPIAIHLLTRVDQGEIHLDQMIQLRLSDLHAGSGTLTDLLNQLGVAISVHNLMELMLLISDNSATDVCLRLMGGQEAITGRMRALGIDGIDVNRSTVRLIADWGTGRGSFASLGRQHVDLRSGDRSQCTIYRLLGSKEAFGRHIGAYLELSFLDSFGACAITLLLLSTCASYGYFGGLFRTNPAHHDSRFLRCAAMVFDRRSFCDVIDSQSFSEEGCLGVRRRIRPLVRHNQHFRPRVTTDHGCYYRNWWGLNYGVERIKNSCGAES
jgi:hypothetical protein